MAAWDLSGFWCLVLGFRGALVLIGQRLERGPPGPRGSIRRP